MSQMEKMARGMVEERFGDPDATFVTALGKELPEWPRFVPLARAALLAIREPGGRAQTAGANAIRRLCPNTDLYVDGPIAGQVFAAMIDAILAEEPRP